VDGGRFRRSAHAAASVWSGGQSDG
jgi:hypothetical protein